MFSFVKKLFSFQKTDRNTVVEEPQVKLEANSNCASPVAPKIKDIILYKSCKNNASHQQVELRKFSDFYPKESIFSDSNKSLNKSYKNNETHQKIILSKFSNFHAEERTSAASESNVHGRFDNQISTIPKIQRKCKKLAIKKIKEVMKDLSLDPNEIDDMVDECKEQKSRKKPKIIKKLYKLHQKTIRFCLQCKISQNIVGKASLRKSCNKCSSILYYLCTICKDKYYASYCGWKAHQNKCNCKSTSQKMKCIRSRRTSNQYLNSNLNVVEKIVRLRLIKTKGITQAKKRILENTGDGVNIEGGMGKVLIKKVIAVKTNKFKKWIRRYCPNCEKPVIGKTPYMKKKITCHTCTSLLQFQCVKCHTIKTSDTSMYHHLHQKFFRFDHTSIKSKIRSTKSRLMSSIQLIQNKYFKCDMCTYQSKVKANLKRHVTTVHMRK